jgi:hypothetical protein
MVRLLQVLVVSGAGIAVPRGEASNGLQGAALALSLRHPGAGTHQRVDRFSHELGD